MKKTPENLQHVWSEVPATNDMVTVSCSCNYAPKDNPVLINFVKALRERHDHMVNGVQE